MMFLSYDGIDMKFMSNLPSHPRNDFKETFFEECFLEKSSKLPRDDVP